jgi:hypothetical protein
MRSVFIVELTSIRVHPLNNPNYRIFGVVVFQIKYEIFNYSLLFRYFKYI